MGKKVIQLLILLLLICTPVCIAENWDDQPARRVSGMYDFSGYMQDVRDKIQKSWNPPEVMEEGRVDLIFKIDKSGDLISYQIKQGSGNHLYDESAIEALKKASPFKILPADCNREYITVKYSFESSIVKTDKVKELVQISEKYTNVDNKLALNYIDRAIQEIQGDYASYFLYARRHKINKLMGNNSEAESDLAQCKKLKALYDKRRINTCKKAAEIDPTPFAYFTLANAYELAGDYNNAIINIDRAISMTELNQAYKRYRAEIVMKRNK